MQKYCKRSFKSWVLLCVFFLNRPSQDMPVPPVSSIMESLQAKGMALLQLMFLPVRNISKFFCSSALYPSFFVVGIISSTKDQVSHHWNFLNLKYNLNSVKSSLIPVYVLQKLVWTEEFLFCNEAPVSAENSLRVLLSFCFSSAFPNCSTTGSWYHWFNFYASASSIPVFWYQNNNFITWHWEIG